MLGYVTIGTNDFVRAKQFFDELMAVIGESCLWQTESMAAWGSSRDEPTVCIAEAFDGETATIGNGVMLALNAVDFTSKGIRDVVEFMHERPPVVKEPRIWTKR